MCKKDRFLFLHSQFIELEMKVLPKDQEPPSVEQWNEESFLKSQAIFLPIKCHWAQYAWVWSLIRLLPAHPVLRGYFSYYLVLISGIPGWRENKETNGWLLIACAMLKQIKQNLIIHTDATFTDHIQFSGAESISILMPARQHETLARDTKMNELMPLPARSPHRIPWSKRYKF